MNGFLKSLPLINYLQPVPNVKVPIGIYLLPKVRNKLILNFPFAVLTQLKQRCFYVGYCEICHGWNPDGTTRIWFITDSNTGDLRNAFISASVDTIVPSTSTCPVTELKADQFRLDCPSASNELSVLHYMIIRLPSQLVSSSFSSTSDFGPSNNLETVRAHCTKTLPLFPHGCYKLSYMIFYLFGVCCINEFTRPRKLEIFFQTRCIYLCGIF